MIKYKKDLLYILFIFIFYIVSALFLGHIYGSLYIDCGREAILPELVLKGKILYKDIFAMYNPLSYQINAILYFIFGSSLKTLYGAAYVNAFVMLIGLYLICRRFINEYFSFVITLLIASVYVFGCTGLCSYLFPYSFAFTYALTCFIYSVLFCLLYMEKDNKYFLYLSSVLLGLSFANKPEFSICIIPLIFLIRKDSSKTLLQILTLFVLPVIFSYSILFLQGFSIDDLIKYFDFIINFFKTDEQQLYTQSCLMGHLNYQYFKSILLFAAKSIGYFIVCILYFNLFSKNLYYKIAGLCLFPAFINYSIFYASFYFY